MKELPWKIGQQVWIIETNAKDTSSDEIVFIPSEQEITGFQAKLGQENPLEYCLSPYGWCSVQHIFETEEACEKRALELVEEAKKGIILVADEI